MIFRRDGGEVVHLKTKKRTPCRRVGNVYIMDAWIEKPRDVKRKATKWTSTVLNPRVSAGRMRDDQFVQLFHRPAYKLR